MPQIYSLLAMLGMSIIFEATQLLSSSRVRAMSLNFDVAIDVMFIRLKPSLHAVCKKIHSRVMQSLQNKSHTHYGLRS